jgi:hypothetical protein
LAAVPHGLYGRDKVSYWHDIALQRSFLKEDRLTVKLNAQRALLGQVQEMDQLHHARRLHRLELDESAGTQFHHLGELPLRLAQGAGEKTNVTIENNDVVGGASKGQGGQQGGSGN